MLNIIILAWLCISMIFTMLLALDLKITHPVQLLHLAIRCMTATPFIFLGIISGVILTVCKFMIDDISGM